MARPEGYRKAARLMGMADHFDVPVIALIDTAGAYPGIGAEERGQAEAIARSTEACLEIGVPNVATIIGEGGSGGAIAIATANRVLMLEHAIYSVISPEGAASILWRDTAKAQEAASSMKITAQDLVRFGVVDAHRARADRRRASRPGRGHRGGGRSDRRRARRIARSRPRHHRAAAARKVLRHRAHARLIDGSCRHPSDGRRKALCHNLAGIGPRPRLGSLIRWIYRSNSTIIYHSFKQRAWSSRSADGRLPCESHLLWITIRQVMARGWSICRGILP